jgi:hypothetical protein
LAVALVVGAMAAGEIALILLAAVGSPSPSATAAPGHCRVSTRDV